MTVEQITQCLANAYVTRARALGHGKTQGNEIMVKQYREQLINMGVDVPALDLFTESEFKKQLWAIGQFNGEGSY
jgi:hypothetical protein